MKKNNILKEMEKMLPKKRVERAKKEAEKEIFNIRLSQLRNIMGVKQEDIKHFSQSSVSKIEKRNDIKISTLIEYFSEIGMSLEIKATPKKVKGEKVKEYVLLHT